MMARRPIPQPETRISPTSSDLLQALAQRVQHLSPDRRNPEHFHLEKSDVVHELRKLARRIEAAR